MQQAHMDMKYLVHNSDIFSARHTSEQCSLLPGRPPPPAVSRFPLIILMDNSGIAGDLAAFNEMGFYLIYLLWCFIVVVEGCSLL